MKKYTQEELFKMDAVDVYKMVLKGDVIKKFPNGFWQQPEAKQNAAKCTRYLINEILKYDETQLKKNNSTYLYSRNKLSGMLQICFNDSPYEVINNAYPNKYKEWELNYVPESFWSNEENRIRAIKWLIEDKLKLNDEELKEQLSINLFKNYGLATLVKCYCNNSPYSAINSVYPNKFKEWEFKQVPKKYWSKKENRIRAIKWLIEDKLKLNDEELKEQLSQKLFANNGLGSMLNNYFNASPFDAINSIYPNRFKEWEFKQVPKGYWDNKENGIRAAKWLIEDKLKLTDEELKEQLSIRFFTNNGLAGMLNYCFDNSPYIAVNSVYPNKFKKSDFKNYIYYK